ncbi:MAG: hypothetical protein AAF543_06695 [Pseudomonadota bacterium]
MTGFAAPFEIRHAPLRQYCEVVFSGHDHYRSIELQYLEISRKRRGFVVLLNTKGEGLDVLSEPSLSLDEEWCRNDPSVSDYRLGRVETVELKGAFLKSGADGVDARVSFQDHAGRQIDMAVASAASGPAKSRNLFVPANPKPKVSMLWFLYLFEFGPLRFSDKIDIRIDGQPIKPNKWPWPIRPWPYVQGRYANDIAFFSLNPPAATSMPMVDNDDAFDLVPIDGAAMPAIRSWTKREQGHDLEARFDPPLSTIDGSGQAIAGNGTFAMAIDGMDIAKGRYQLSSADGQTELAFTDVNQYWRPPEKDFSVWMLEFYHRLKAGRRRWHWTATMRPSDDQICCDGGWVLR